MLLYVVTPSFSQSNKVQWNPSPVVCHAWVLKWLITKIAHIPETLWWAACWIYNFIVQHRSGLWNHLGFWLSESTNELNGLSVEKKGRTSYWKCRARSHPGPGLRAVRKSQRKSKRGNQLFIITQSRKKRLKYPLPRSLSFTLTNNSGEDFESSYLTANQHHSQQIPMSS